MTRDYKPPSRSKKTPASGSGSSLLVGILIGLLLGLGIALAVAIYLNKVPGPFLSQDKPGGQSTTAKPAAPKAPAGVKAPEPVAKSESIPEEKPRFDFYNILPGGDDATKSKPASKTPPAVSSETKETFYLQAGAFQGAADADNMKARLAMLGVEAAVQTSTSSERGTLHRVRIGPFRQVEEVNRTRETLKQNGIESTLIKGRDKAN